MFGIGARLAFLSALCAAGFAAASAYGFISEQARTVRLGQEARAQEMAALALFERDLSLCPGMRVSNAPPADGARTVVDFWPFVDVEGVRIAIYPTRGACLSSAFGPRGRGFHAGLDFYARAGGPILSAGDGVVLEARYEGAYGNMILIDHGAGVYTRYAHLAAFAPSVAPGARVRMGREIGRMGATGDYRVPVHLHFEVLTGDYDTLEGSFGLTPRSPFDFPRLCAGGAPCIAHNGSSPSRS